jgi:hypothetical protein
MNVWLCDAVLAGMMVPAAKAPLSIADADLIYADSRIRWQVGRMAASAVTVLCGFLSRNPRVVPRGSRPRALRNFSDESGGTVCDTGV